MIKTDIILDVKYNNEDILTAVATALPVDKSEIRDVRIVKRALSISDTARPHYRTTVALSLDPEREAGLLKMRKKVAPYEYPEYTAPTAKLGFRPVVVGAGPAGLFSALVLAEAGASPIVLERGLDVDKRERRVDFFNKTGILDPECNVQFGEGGAGTFSDGKLKVGSMDKYKMKVLTELVLAGADPSVLYSTDAHVGTDKLSAAVKLIREKIISLGGEFIFSARLTDFTVRDGALKSVTYRKDEREVVIETEAVIFAVGHSARDTVRMLRSRGLDMSAKGFGVGVRIEHPREYINSIVYKESKDIIDATASYHLVTHLSSGRSVYSFCMCPGGTVVAATSEEGAIVTNGMSESARMADNSNAALLVSLTPCDFGSPDPLSGIEYQERIERRAFALTDSYKAPFETVGSFLGRGKSDASVTPSYKRGAENIAISEALPDFVTDSLALGICEFGDWLDGYALDGAVLTAPETRTTSPVRIERDETGSATGFVGIYPAGEGAGYAGGIVSSAVDGMHEAEKLLLKFNKK